MSSIILFFIFILFLAFALLALNLLLAPHNPYAEKVNVFECGFSSFLGQNRQEFSISFFVFGLLFLIFDLEIVLIYPYVVSAYNNSIYGLVIVLVFLSILTAGFVFEIGKGALKINSRQSNNLHNIYITPVASPSHFASSSAKRFNKKLNLNPNAKKRFYSTKSEKSQHDEFFKQIARSLREGIS
jgi:NADH-ubiquinone oxidoreductase chain 3